MEYPDKGCGRTDAELILYEVLPSGAHALTSGFAHTFCGDQPDCKGFDSYGILLCRKCAERLGFPPPSDSANEAGADH